jgi:hypothetical protein
VPELPLEDPRKGRAQRWRDGTDHLLARLKESQQRAIRRARSGQPPGYILGRYDDAVSRSLLEAPLSEIEGIARELLRGYEWPDAGDWSSGQDHPSWPASGFVDRQGFED